HHAGRRPRGRQRDAQVCLSDRIGRKDETAETGCRRRAKELRDDVRDREPRLDAPGRQGPDRHRRGHVRAGNAAETGDGEREPETGGECDAHDPQVGSDRRRVGENGRYPRETEVEGTKELRETQSEGLHSGSCLTEKGEWRQPKLSASSVLRERV